MGGTRKARKFPSENMKSTIVEIEDIIVYETGSQLIEITSSDIANNPQCN